MKKTQKRRAVSGILLLDKSQGTTSNCALQRVKRFFNAQKAGHTGSLDPLATGMLPICFGEATKVSSFLLNADKCYQTTMRLGQVTDTGDADGQVLREFPVEPIDPENLQAILKEFMGTIMQTPPMYSALKHQGQPLYALARKGVTITRAERQVTISELSLIQQTDTELKLQVRCSKGTYIRTLVEDIGRRLGCGAHVKTLRRLYVEPFKSEPTITLSELEMIADNYIELDQHLKPVDCALGHWPSARLSPDGVKSLFMGREVTTVAIDDAPIGSLIRLYSTNQGFLGMGKVLLNGRVAPKRLIQQSSTTTPVLVDSQ
ncbi:MAG: tRNA pseudouridine(55) synthase TruB [Gammaproteobacteria bacterium]|nr:tRNA pseudouridine(55) synthase TruB [Gammaproteobacteria bacterium]